MVGTYAIIKPSKELGVNENSNDLEQCEESLQSDYSTVRNRRHRSRSQKSGYEFFRSFYLLLIFILCFFASILLTCTVKKMLQNSKYINFSSGTSVLVYDGKEKYVTWPDPPPHDDVAARARYVMHISEWGSLATNSTHEGIEGYPFVNIFAVSDGPFSNASGTPYFYFTELELSVKDMEKNNKVSLTLSEAQSNFCNKNEFDPEDPRCAHIIFTGSMIKVPKGSEEEEFAKSALFSRHEEMKDWPPGHHWFFAKMDIIHIYVLDYFGGASVVPLDDYYSTNPFE